MDGRHTPFEPGGRFSRHAWRSLPPSGVLPSRRRLLVASARAALAFVLLAPGIALLARPAASAARATPRPVLTVLEQRVVDRINGIRRAHGLVPLRLSARLSTAAIAHSSQMIEDGYFGHGTATGESFAQRLEYYYPVGRSSFYNVGENLYWTSTRAQGWQVVTSWMLSPPHRANLLSPNWRQIGVAAVAAPSAPGVYEGLHVTVVTVDFGIRRLPQHGAGRA